MNAHKVLAGEKRWSIDCMQILKWAKKLPDRSVQCIITSPPYWGLRDYGVKGQIGLEPTPTKYIEKMVPIFRELRRVLRDDGVLFLNLGDTYQNQKSQGGYMDHLVRGRKHLRYNRPNDLAIPGLKQKDLIGIPWMFAFALRNDGWWLRNEIIWQKPNAMAESAQDRFGRDHEQVFMLTKSKHYFFDVIATQEPSVEAGKRSPKFSNWAAGPGSKHEAIDHNRQRIRGRAGKVFNGKTATDPKLRQAFREVSKTRNKRTVWRITTRKFKGAHFATFPPNLVHPMIRAATSERGCCTKCGKPVKRLVEKKRVPTRPGKDTKLSKDRKTGEQLELNGKPWASAEVGNRDPQRHITVYETIGWERCKCDAPLRGCLVMDPFAGSGTVGQVALEHGQDFIGCDLSKDYCLLVEKRMEGVTPQLIVETA